MVMWQTCWMEIIPKNFTERGNEVEASDKTNFQSSPHLEVDLTEEVRPGVAHQSHSHTNHAPGPAVGSDTPQPLSFQPQISQFPDGVGEKSAPCLE